MRSDAEPGNLTVLRRSEAGTERDMHNGFAKGTGYTSILMTIHDYRPKNGGILCDFGGTRAKRSGAKVRQSCRRMPGSRGKVSTRLSTWHAQSALHVKGKGETC